ncbi:MULTISPECIES: hypothetical protein [Amycolatopsis]|nr:hypothetical protein [Amycolatopsis bullii]
MVAKPHSPGGVVEVPVAADTRRSIDLLMRTLARTTTKPDHRKDLG